MRPTATLAALLLGALPARAEEAAPARTAFLMHGILNVRLSMSRVEKALRARGFKVVNLDYPSRSKTVEEHADWLDEVVRQEGQGELFFVGHSLGSIVIRCYLARYKPKGAKRFVMLSPPNHGSVAADLVDRTGLYSLVWGERAGGQLRASRKDFWETLPAPPIEFGIIAGGAGDGKGLNPMIEGDDDGTVAVSEARLEGAKEFLVLPYQHTTILLKKEVVQRTVRFLETGSFK